jgi:hypothetical protein
VDLGNGVERCDDKRDHSVLTKISDMYVIRVSNAAADLLFDPTTTSVSVLRVMAESRKMNTSCGILFPILIFLMLSLLRNGINKYKQ